MQRNVTGADTPLASAEASASYGATQTVITRGVAEVVSGDVSGGPNTSHTIMVRSLAGLLEAVPATGRDPDYERAAVTGNVLAKQTEGARRRTFRYLKELYLLRPEALLFRALRDLWSDDPAAQPLLAGVCALARDAVFRASSTAILGSRPGDVLNSRDFAAAVAEHFPETYRDSTLAKIGRNVFSSWEQTGHLTAGERTTKVRTRASCGPSNVAYALMVGYLEGARGQALFETLWAKVLDQPQSHLQDLAVSASQRGLLEFRRAGGVVEVSFHELLRPIDGLLL